MTISTHWNRRTILTILLLIVCLGQPVLPVAAAPAPAPATFGKLSPTNGATNQPTAITLSWRAASGATRYGYCVNTINSCPNGDSGYTATSATSATVTGLLPGTTYYWQVRAYDATGFTPADGTGAWWSFTTATLPGALNKLSPANGSSTQPTSLTLAWRAASGATGYGYCVSTTNSCPNGDSGYTRLAGTSATIAGLAPSTTYYWQVRAYSAAGFTPADGSGGWWSFTTAPLPAAFSKISPANGASNQATSAPLTWRAASGATSYGYCISTSPGCPNGDSGYVRVSGTSATVPGLLGGTTYYWQARAYSAAGFTPADRSGAWWSFTTAPTAATPGAFSKVGPANGASNQATNPTLTWKAASGATGYGYCISTSPSCPNGDSGYTLIPGTSITISDLQPGTTYYWQARAYNAAGFTPADGSGAWWSFTTAPASALPAAFSKVGPANGASNQATHPTLSWTAASGATQYGYCISTSAGCPNGDSGYTRLASTSATITGLAPGTTYYWQVRAYNAAGLTPANGVGAWWSFTTAPASALPTAFGKTSPAQQAINQPLTATLTWRAAAQATQYGYCLNRNPNYACEGGDTGYTRISGTSVQIPNLLPGTTYYWQVRAYNAAGFTVADGAGAWWSFTTAAPAAPPASFGKLSPANSAANQPLAVTLTWNGTSGATQYGYCLNTVNSCAGGDTGYRLTADPRATIIDLAPNTTYYWQVRAYNAAGFTPANGVGGWWSFTTGAAPAAPAMFYKAAPINGATSQPTTLTLSWDAAPGATQYRYCVNTTTGCNGGDSGFKVAAGTSVGISGLEPGKTYYWQVRAYNSAGFIPANGIGEWWSFTTTGTTGSLSGYIPGQLRANESGAAGYTIPLDVTPGTAGVAPELALVYDSRGGNSVVGWGWSLAGLSLIGRCPTTIAQHGFVDGVDFDGNDQFCLDGQLLVASVGRYGEDGTVYRTENETFVKAVSYGRAGNGPERFKVWTKAGLIMEYGVTADSRIEAQDRTAALYWAVNKIEDTKGNALTITYAENNPGGEAYPVRIDYTSNLAQGLAPYAAISFVYEDRPDVSVQYVGGSAVRTAKRLQSVNVTLDGAVVRTYRLGYEGGMAAKRSRLTSVTLCAGDGTCLASTQLGWSSSLTNTENFDAPGSGGWQGHAGGVGNNIAGDFNGDGLTDLTGYTGSGGRWDMRLSTGSGFQGVPNWQGHADGIKRTVAGDLNGDGRTDLVGYSTRNDGSWNVCFSTGTNFACQVWQGHRGGIERNTTGDFNGDGLTDLAGYSEAGRWHVCLSTGSGFACSFWVGHSGGIERNVTGDFNGDGLTDLAGYGDAGSWHICLSTGFSFSCAFWQGHAGGIARNASGDFNGDGLTDLAGYGDAGRWHVCLSTGLSFSCAFWQGHSGGAANNMIADFNGDGRTDLGGYTGSNGVWHVCLSGGDGFACRMWISHSGGAGNNVVADFNGDGKSDMAGYTGSNGLWDVRLAGGNVLHLVTSITTGHGVTTRISYRPLTDRAIYTRDADAVYPRRDVQGALYVVAATSSSDGVSGERQVRYSYAGLKVNLRGRGFLGFRVITATDAQTGITTTTFYHQTHPFKSLVLKTEQRLPNGQLISAVENTWAVLSYNQYQPAASGAAPSSSDSLSTLQSPNTASVTYFPYIQRSVARTFELDGSLINETTTDTTYDSYGNPTLVAVRHSDGYAQTTTNTYTNDSVTWLLGRLTKAVVTAEAPGQAPQTRSSAFAYDPSSGLLTREEVEPGTALAQTKTYEYDRFGNISRSTVSGPDVAARTQTTEYNPRGRFVTKSINPLGHTEARENDARFGTMTKLTGPNGLVTTWSYDGFGRLSQENRSDGTQTTKLYRRCGAGECPARAIAYVRTQASGTPPSVEYVDLLDRTIRQETIGFDGRKVFVDTDYDARGQVVRVSDPYFTGTTPVWTEYRYDILGRVQIQVAPDGGETTTRYRGLTTEVVNPLGQITSRTTNSQGQVVRSTDALGNVIRYTVDSFGNMVTMVDPAGNTTTMQYDRRGRKTLMRDPDMGTMTYRYNAVGELIGQKDAKGQDITLRYDALGRMTERREPEGTSVWVYDTQPKGIGQLAEVRGPDGYKEVYTYDTLGRPRSKTTTIAGQSYTVSTSFDQYSRPETTTYPTGFATKQVYNAQGYLSEVRNAVSSAWYWRATTVNARGQVEAETLGNQLVTIRGYDRRNGDLTAIQTGPTGGSASVQQLAYTFDVLGNLLSRTDTRQSLTERFSYDDLNRLTQAAVTGRAPQTVRYNAIGNITAKSGVGDYTYGQNGAGPHAVTSITGSTSKAMSYDANGNRLTSGAGSVTYTSFNNARVITEGGRSITFAYGPDHKRYQKTVQANGATTTTIYLDGLYEKETTASLTTHKHYISNGSGVLAVYTTRSDNTQQTLYLHKDHLGSLDTVTNDTGAVVERLSFDAWGQRRTSDWRETTTPITSAVNRGYTGHEQLDDVGLVHMGGRVYDPVVGRFLSADPFVQAPENLQSLNRYSYVLNNPLSYTDPTGFFFSGVKKFLKDNWKTIAAAVATIATGVWISGLLAPGLWSAVAGGAAGGFVGGATNTLLFGGSVSDALAAGVRAGIMSGLTAGAFYGVGSASFLNDTGRIVGHGVVGGVSSKLQGGKFEHGFLSGAFTNAFEPLIDGIDPSNLGMNPYRTIAAAIVGGTAAELGGGKFANGAITGAFSRMYNDDSHPRYKESDEARFAREEARDPELYWEVRLAEGDPLAKTALDIVRREIGLGVLTSNRLFKVAWDHGIKYNHYDVTVKMMDAHHEALMADRYGIAGSLSTRQITEYHHRVFNQMGLPARAFGGTPIFGQQWETIGTSWMWCSGCDDVP